MNDQDKIQRTVPPIPDQPLTGLITYDAKDPRQLHNLHRECRWFRG
jgi:hypothetical protein